MGGRLGGERVGIRTGWVEEARHDGLGSDGERRRY
jgi:hypothetical protein